jgi:glycosyltransferase involved in cell wall biosynthesis
VRILVDYRPALRERTGVGEYIHQVARSIGSSLRSGESLTLFSSSWKDRLAPDLVPGAAVVDRRVPVRVLNFAWNRLEWPGVEQLAGGAFDVVHSLHPLLIPSRRAAQVITIHDLDFLDRPDRARTEVGRDYPALVASHARRADCVLVNSQHTAGEVERRLGLPASKIVRAYPGTPDWPRRAAEPESGCILFLGTLEPRKNVGTLLDAYEMLIAGLPGAPPLVLAGGATPEAAPWLARAAAPPFAGRVSFPGYVDEARRLDLYRRALVFVLPSHTEGFGMPVAEAMRCGVPVIVSNRGALPEVAGPAGRLIDPSDAASLAQALRDVITNPDLRRRMSDAGAQHARQFTWSATADRVRDAWALAIDQRSRRRG